jgi:hypothetical protein
VRAGEAGRDHHDRARAHDQQRKPLDDGKINHRMNSGSRRIKSLEKPVSTRSIQGKVNANAAKIASARGMNPSTLSWIDVTV